MDPELVSYRQILKKRLEELSERNPAYSLRAMARDLALAPSLLSDVINNKRSISPERAIAVSNYLKLSRVDAEIFVLLVQLEGTTAETVREQLARRISELQQSSESAKIASEQFELLTKWFNFPVLESIDLHDFEFSAARVAKKLGLKSTEAEEAIASLMSLGLLVKDQTGKYSKADKRLQFASIGPNLALRYYHKEMLKQAAVALETQSNAEKFVGTATFALSSADLEKANEILEQAFTRITTLAKQSNKRDAIYHLGVQLFRLSQKDC